jgi:putative transposase
LGLGIEDKRVLIEAGVAGLSIRRQCELLELDRGSYYYTPGEETAENLDVMRRLDRLYVKWPFLGSRRLVEFLRRQGIEVNRKRVQRLMRLMGLEAICPKRHLSANGTDHRIYPYLLRGLEIVRPNQVWAADITYIPMRHGFLYLVAILDWYSRYVVTWKLSNSLDAAFCREALKEALCAGSPDIFNTDQGVQFTSDEFTQVLRDAGVKVSMDGKGRVFDNIFTERLWRSVKYEEVYLKAYEDGWDTQKSLGRYFAFYNTIRPHQALEYQTPAEVHRAKAA